MALRRPHRWALWPTMSVALNLFLGGVLLGYWLSNDPPLQAWPRGAGIAAPGFSVAGILFAVPEAAREEAERMLSARAGDIERGIRSLREAQAGVVAAMAREPHDPAGVQSALQQLRARSGALQAVLHQALSDIAGELAGDERERLARAIFEGALRGIPLAYLEWARAGGPLT